VTRYNRTMWMGIIALAAAGCCAHRSDRATSCCEQASEPVQVVEADPPGPRFASGLIFDRQPGIYAAEQFTYRSEWPSTLGYYRAPEVIFYREHFRDRQGPGWSFQDQPYRRFDTVRMGQAVR